MVERLGIVFPPVISRASDREKFGRIGDVTVERISEFAVVAAQVRRALASEELDVVGEAWRKIRAANLSVVHEDLTGSSEFTADESMERELKGFANLVRHYAEPYLRGDFTSWLGLHEYQRDWLIASQLLGRRGVPTSREEIEGEFWRTEEYLTALRAEYGTI